MNFTDAKKYVTETKKPVYAYYMPRQEINLSWVEGDDPSESGISAHYLFSPSDECDWGEEDFYSLDTEYEGEFFENFPKIHTCDFETGYGPQFVLQYGNGESPCPWCQEYEEDPCPCGCGGDVEKCVYSAICPRCGKKFVGIGYAPRDQLCSDCRGKEEGS